MRKKILYVIILSIFFNLPGTSFAVENTKNDNAFCNVEINDILYEFDMKNNYWAKDAVYYIFGRLSSNFNVERSEPVYQNISEPISRSQFLVTLFQMDIIDLFGYTQKWDSQFVDISVEDYIYEYVLLFSNAGIIIGDDNNRFNPESYLTKQDAAIILDRYLSLLNLDVYQTPIDVQVFEDDNTISDYAHDSIYRLKGMHIIHGENNVFNSNNLITIAEVCTMFFNTFKYLDKVGVLKMENYMINEILK